MNDVREQTRQVLEKGESGLDRASFDCDRREVNGRPQGDPPTSSKGFHAEPIEQMHLRQRKAYFITRSVITM